MPSKNYKNKVLLISLVQISKDQFLSISVKIPYEICEKNPFFNRKKFIDIFIGDHLYCIFCHSINCYDFLINFR